MPAPNHDAAARCSGCGARPDEDHATDCPIAHHDDVDQERADPITAAEWAGARYERGAELRAAAAEAVAAGTRAAAPPLVVDQVRARIATLVVAMLEPATPAELRDTGVAVLALTASLDALA